MTKDLLIDREGTEWIGWVIFPSDSNIDSAAFPSVYYLTINPRGLEEVEEDLDNDDSYYSSFCSYYSDPCPKNGNYIGLKLIDDTFFELEGKIWCILN